jgi:hypothetical protein
MTKIELYIILYIPINKKDLHFTVSPSFSEPPVGIEPTTY